MARALSKKQGNSHPSVPRMREPGVFRQGAGPAGAMRAATASGEDQDRPLRRCESVARRGDASSVRLPGFYVQAAQRQGSTRGLHDLLAGGERQGVEGHAREGAWLAPGKTSQPELGAAASGDRPDGAGVGELLRCVPSIHAVSCSASHRRAPRQMGAAQVQADGPTPASCLGVVAGAAIPHASAVPALVGGYPADWTIGAV